MECYQSIKDIKQGEFVKRKDTAQKVYIRGEYDKSLKKYWLQSWDDISSGIWVKGTAQVYIGFTF